MSVELPYRLTETGKNTINKVRNMLNELNYQSWFMGDNTFNVMKKSRIPFNLPQFRFHVFSDDSIMLSCFYSSDEKKLVELAEKLASMTGLKIRVV